MRNRILRSVLISLEWRVIAYIITNLFFWVTTRHFWTAAGLALLLQIILFFAHLIWYFLRLELHISVSPYVTKKMLPWW